MSRENIAGNSDDILVCDSSNELYINSAFVGHFIDSGEIKPSYENSFGFSTCHSSSAFLKSDSEEEKITDFITSA